MSKITEFATNISVLSLDKYASTNAVNSSPMAAERLVAVINTSLEFWNGSSWVILGSGGGGGSTWESLYAADNIFDVVGGNGFEILGAMGNANPLLTLTMSGGDSGAALVFAQGGSGNDITGTSGSWSVTKTGIGTFLDVSISGTSAALATTGAAVWTILDNSATSLRVGPSGGPVMLTFDTSNAAEVLSTNATVFQVTLGKTNLINGSNTVSTLVVTDNTVTTFGAAANSSGVAVLRSTSLTTGSLLQLQLTGATLNGGFYLTARDVTLSANVFTIGENGATTIAGVVGNNEVTVTAGNILASAGSITAAYDTSTATTVFAISGSGAFTGTTTTSFATITPSGLTSGTAVYMPLAALDAGKGLQIIGNALTTGQLVSIASSATAIATTGRLFLSTHSGNAGTSAVLNEFTSAAADETVILKVTASAANALGTAFAISSATTTGNAQTITANSLTSGKSLLVTSSSASTDGATSFEPALFTTTMTGAGGVGGRVRAYMTTNVALGAWSNALKGEVVYGASGKTAGLGSSILAEMTLSAGTTPGTYAPFEAELNLGAGALTGAATSFMYLSVNETGGNTAFTTNGYILNLAGMSAGASNVFRTGIVAATLSGNTTAALRIKIGATDYFIPLATATV